MLFCATSVFGQTNTVTGTITDETGEPLIGASVVVKGTTNGSITDVNGKYTLQQVSAQSTLVFTYIGYLTHEVLAGSQRTINVQLKEDTQRLDEVVVVGYGSQTKRDITASVAVIDTKKLLRTSGSSATQQMQGKAAGVYIGTSGAPGGQSMVRIRGVNTINDNGPLYVIDGVSSRNQDMNSINPNDIESLQILKDASAAAIYGAQAANGVILITTKQGSKSGQPVLTYDAYFGMQHPGKRYDVLNSKDRMDLEYTSKLNQLKITGAYDKGERPAHSLFKTEADGFAPYKYLSNKGGLDNIDPNTYSYPDNIYALYSDTNWWDEVTDDYAPMQSHQLGLSGGTDKGQYNISLGYFDQNSVHKHRYYTRYSTRLNSSFNVRPWLRVGENLSFAWWKSLGSVNDASESSIYSWTYRATPWAPVYDLGGNFAGSIIPDTGNWQNPVSILYREKDNYWSNLRLFGNAWAEVDLLKGLTLRTSFGLDYTSAYHYRMNKKNLEFSESPKQNDLEEHSEFNFRWVWSNTATYKTTINDIHKLTVMVGTEAIRDGLGRALTGQRYNYTLEDNVNTWVLNMGENNDQRVAESSYNGEFALFGIFGRVDYSLMDKYLLTFNMRRDGVSRFSPENRYGNFPSVSVGWRISEENFMAPSRTWLDDLKIRFGYGLTGNSDVPRATNFANEFIIEPTRSNYDISGTNGGTTGFRLARYGNLNTKWEAVESYNIGLDASVLSGKFSAGIEFYRKKTTNMLIQAAYSGLSGEADAPYINFGSMRNTGYDANITYRGSKRDWKWEIGLNLSQYKNEILKLSDADDYALWREGTRLSGSVTRTIKGRPISEFYGYKVDGFYENVDQVKAILPLGYDRSIPMTDAVAQQYIGKFIYADLDGNGYVDSNDRTVIGSPHPDLIAGLNVGLNYKNWDFTMFWYSTLGNDLFNNTLAFTDFQLFRGNRSSRMRDLSWEPGKTNAVLPILDSGDVLSLNTNSYFVEDASFLRLKNVVLGYTFPKDLLKKATISNLRLYAQVENPLTFTKYRGLDPEFTNADTSEGNGADLRRGLDMGSWPNIIRIIFGLNFAF
ncbi:MAG: TonB-dependent receptor [Candidatus Azobacteroides sp.]|nr:TonB-dependent receptor [Candidatus Azobacteroides sp.]